jgi:hypothetical protein
MSAVSTAASSLRLAQRPTSTLRAPVTGVRASRAKAGDRLSNSVEVAVSKIFPAGAGWQTASIVAGNMGMACDSVAFFLTVGMGDLLGVFIGHTLYQLLKKNVARDSTIKMREQVQVAALLGGAALFSGFTWQPALNAMNKFGLGFNGAFCGVGVACTLAFFVGLRIWRTLLNPTMKAVEKNTFPNLKADFQLSAAIGAATAFFVGTDVSFGAANWLAGLVGITSSMPSAIGCAVAGISTSLGFMAAQFLMAVGLPRGKCWIDPETKFSDYPRLARQ